MPAILWIIDRLIIAIVGLPPGLVPSLLVQVLEWEMRPENDNG
jgi:hypothetical protein